MNTGQGVGDDLLKKVVSTILTVSIFIVLTGRKSFIVDKPIISSRTEYLQSKAPSESGYIYYSTGNNIVRIKSGDKTEEAFTDFFADFLFTVEDWVYYYDYRNDGATYNEPILHRRKEDSSLDETVIETPVKSVSYYNKCIYYMPGQQFTYGLYRANPDGSQQSQITDESISRYYFEENYIYVLNSSNDLIRMNHNGDSRKQLIDGAEYSAIGITDVYFDKNHIYFLADLPDNWLDNRYIFRIDKNGSDLQQLTDKSVGNFILSGRYIYFIAGETSISNQYLYKMSVNGGKTKKISRRKLPDYSTFLEYDGVYVYTEFVDLISKWNSSDESFESASFYKIKCDK